MVAATPFFADRGSHIRILNEMRQLRAAGWDVQLISYSPWYAKLGGQLGPGAALLKIPADIDLLFRMFFAYWRFRPSIVHAHGWEALCICRSAMWCAAILRRNQAPLILDAQGSLAEEFGAYNSPIAKAPLIAIEKILLKLPDAIIASSEWGRESLAARGILATKISVIDDGFPDEITPAHAETKARAKGKIGVSPERQVCMYTGSMLTAKGVDIVLENIPAILAALKGSVFVFAGYGPLVEVYRRKYADMVAAGKIMFLGRVSYADLPHVLHAADIAIDPKRGRSEGSGKIPNYLAAGLPTVCFIVPIPALSPYVVHIQNTSAQALIDALTLASTVPPPPLPANLRHEYSWHSSATKLIELYDSLLQPGGEHREK